MKKFIKSFTLAEVLITLTIIGVIAALTIPTLMQKYNNMVVETRLKKVYSVMNQAIQMAEAEYGTKEMWDFSDPDFYEKYYAPYLKVIKVDITDPDSSNKKFKLIYFPDGSLLAMKTSNNKDYFFFPNAKNYSDNDLLYNRVNVTGITLFAFRFDPHPSGSTSVGDTYNEKGFLPYLHTWKGTGEDLISGRYGCRANNSNGALFCTAYIMQNGWKIPKEYPFIVK